MNYSRQLIGLWMMLLPLIAFSGTFESLRDGNFEDSQNWHPTLDITTLSDEDTLLINHKFILNDDLQVVGTLIIREKGNLDGLTKAIPVTVSPSGKIENYGLMSMVNLNIKGQLNSYPNSRVLAVQNLQINKNGRIINQGGMISCMKELQIYGKLNNGPRGLLTATSLKIHKKGTLQNSHHSSQIHLTGRMYVEGMMLYRGSEFQTLPLYNHADNSKVDIKNPLNTGRKQSITSHGLSLGPEGMIRNLDSGSTLSKMPLLSLNVM